MRITPLEIRQKVFEKVFRGYDKDEVNAFLLSLSQEWERVNDENKELRIKYEGSQKEVDKLREVEGSLYKTLKTAEDTGASMIQQANKAAELQLKETQMRAEGILKEAKAKSLAMIEDAQLQTRQILKKMLTDVKELEQSYNLLLTLKDDLISEIGNYAKDTLKKIDKVKEKREKLNIEKHVQEAQKLSVNIEEKLGNQKIDDDVKNIESSHKMSGQVSNKTVKRHNTDGEKSFFDMID